MMVKGIAGSCFINPNASQMLTVFYQRLVCPLMLVLASLGSAPLWLHDAFCHHSECCDTPRAGGFDSTQCPKGESNSKGDSNQCPGCCDAADESALPDLQLRVGGHDCLICFQLSQPQTVTLRAVTYSSERLFSTCRSLSARIVLATVGGPPPARGPPSLA